MPSYIIDANLPIKVPCWSNEQYVHVLKINPDWSDEEIWSYAKAHQLIIISKDKDFSVKQMMEGTPPKLVHVKFGNLKLPLFIQRIELIWQDVVILLQNHSVVNIYLNTIEAIK